LPYLRVKKAQAVLLLELRESKSGGYWQEAYWFAQEFPDWASGDLITTSEAAHLLGYHNRGSISQAISHGTLLALPYDHRGAAIPRVPRLLVERLARNLSRDGRARNQAPELVAWRHRLYEQVRELNKIGLHGTPIYHRTGPYVPAE
jgi:hypothetical protein